MALKAKLEKIEGLPADVAKEYKKVTEGEKSFFVLDLDGAYLSDEPPDQIREALTKAKNHEVYEHGKTKKLLQELTSARDTLEQQLNDFRKGSIPKENAEALERSYKEQFSRREGELKVELEGANRAINELLVENVATKLAAEIAGENDHLILPHIRSRLTVEKGSDGRPKTRVLDVAGQPSAMGIEDLQKEFTQNPKYKAIVVGSKASGGGATGAGSNGGAGDHVDYDPSKYNPATANQQERARHLKWKRENGKLAKSPTAQ